MHAPLPLSMDPSADIIILKVALQMLPNNNRYESVKGLYGLKNNKRSKGSLIVNISTIYQLKFELFENLCKYVFDLQMPSVTSCTNSP